MQRFGCPTTVVSGAGAISALGELGAKRLFVVADPFFHENGLAARIAGMAPESEIFHEVRPDPDLSLVARGTARVKAFGPDWMVALGGGSAMDCAKAMKYFAGIDGPLAAIPTTSGSGSEVTDFAILTHGGVKHPLVDEKLRPALAILDADLLKNLPRSLIADSGFDLLSHALEAWVAKNAGAISDSLARDAFCRGFARLGASYAGDVTVRLEIHEASTMAGISFSQAGLGVCHSLAHALGGAFHVPHGRLNAILLPAVIRANAPAMGHKYAELARAAGLGGSVDTIAVRNLVSGLTRLRRELDLPETLAQAGVKDLASQREAIITAALADPCCSTNPVPVTRSFLAGILDRVAHG